MHHFDAMNSSASSLFRPWSAGSTIKKQFTKMHCSKVFALKRIVLYI